VRYPGAPRFQQLAAIVNMLVTGDPTAVDSPVSLGVAEDLVREYATVRRLYDEQYPALNDAAAVRYWEPFRGVKDTLAILAGRFDLFIASGVTQDILEKDIEEHGFNRSRFRGIFGGNPRGGNDKAQILRAIRDMGYADVLFVADTCRDLEYAQAAGVKFFRIRSHTDFTRLRRILFENGMPNEDQPWEMSSEDREFLRGKTERLVEALAGGTPYLPAAVADWVHEGR
jgi:phosphoglycolate phosphatase-like HAD superfamily hydrolase